VSPVLPLMSEFASGEFAATLSVGLEP
jgi:hypothetical protein